MIIIYIVIKVFQYSLRFCLALHPKELLGEETFGSLSSLDLAKLAVANGEILKRAASDLAPYVFFASQATTFGLPADKIYEVALAGNFLCPFGLNGQIPPFQTQGLCGNLNRNQVWTRSALAKKICGHSNVASLLLSSALPEVKRGCIGFRGETLRRICRTL